MKRRGILRTHNALPEKKVEVGWVSEVVVAMVGGAGGAEGGD